jgi:hypothetical protein
MSRCSLQISGSKVPKTSPQRESFDWEQELRFRWNDDLDFQLSGKRSQAAIHSQDGGNGSTGKDEINGIVHRMQVTAGKSERLLIESRA